MREFRARSRSTRAIFFTQFSLLRWFGCAVPSQKNVGKCTKPAVNVPAKIIFFLKISQSCRTPSRFNSLPCPLGGNTEEQKQVLDSIREAS